LGAWDIRSSAQKSTTNDFVPSIGRYWDANF
jgi:hypothetical protein